VRRLEVEVVARAVQVRGEEEDRIEAVLFAVPLRADENRLLRDSVRCVRLLRVAVPERRLDERDRRELGVRADGADDDELRRLVDPPGFARFAPIPPTSAARWYTSSALALSNICAVSGIDVRS
jgi:hypothetical protein